MQSKKKYSLPATWLSLALMLLLPLFSWGGEPADALFQKGNQLYVKAKYQQASQIYQQIIGKGYQSAAVYFNLGNAYYKLDDMPSAILYYEKAHKLAPNDQDISINIQFANLKIADKIEPQPEFFVARWWHNFILLLPIRTLAVLSDALFIGGFLLLIAYLFVAGINLKKAAFYTGIFLIFFGLISIFWANRQVAYFDNHHQAIIFNSSVIVKGSPDNNGKPLFVIHEGIKVAVTQTNGSWVEIELPNGNAGWILQEAVKDI